MNRKKQRLGDVIIAESVYPYAFVREGQSETIYRGSHQRCGDTLSESFRQRRDNWRLHAFERQIQVHQGLLLSGPKLLDNRQFRDQLIKDFPQALGGEMEGYGAYSAGILADKEVILIKAICDWADGHKNDRAQPFAAYAAVHLANYVLSQPDALDRLGAVDCGLT